MEREPDLELAGQAGDPRAALELLASSPVDVAITDMLMPHTNGISLATELLAARPDLKILALSVLDEPVMISAMLRAGATGYALKTQPADDILVAIRAVFAGELYLPPLVSRDAVLAMVREQRDRPLQRLTRREREIFNLLIHGNTNIQIGSRLFISRRTVETHRLRIMRKLATPSLIEMIRLAAREGALSE